MSHEIENNNGAYSFVRAEGTEAAWHGLGRTKRIDESVDAWIDAAGCGHNVVKVPALAALGASGHFDGMAQSHAAIVPNRFWLTRDDNQYVMGNSVTDIYQIVQPRVGLHFFDDMVQADSRWALDTGGVLKRGEIVFATATFKDLKTVGGDAHTIRVLFMTTYDGTGSTIIQGTATRVVCMNTLRMALLNGAAAIRVRHSTRFNADKARADLAAVLQSFDAYKAAGDAMAGTALDKAQISAMFKAALEIPADAAESDISGRKRNQFAALVAAYRQTAKETESGTAWAAFNAVTRYVDHDRPASKSGVYENEAESRFYSAQFQGGAQMKQRALDFVMPLIKDRIAA